MNRKHSGLIRLLSDDYVFSVVSKLVGVVLAIVYSAFYNRYLGSSLKGEAAIISNYISVISSFACLGMYQAYPFYKKKEGDVFYLFLNTMTSLYLILLVLSIALAIVPGIDVNLKCAIVLVPIHSYIRHINYMVTIEAPRRRNISSLLISIFDLLVVVAFFVCSKANYHNMVAILFVQVVINLILSYSNLKSKLKHFRFTLKMLPSFAKFGFIPMVTLFLMTVNYRIDILMLEKYNNITMAQIGIYSVGVMIAEKVWLIPDAIKDILLSRLCQGKGVDEVAKITRINIAVVIVLTVIVAFISGPFVQIVYGSEYVGADIITIIMLLGVVGMIFYKMVYAYNVSQGKRTINLVLLAMAAVLNVIGNMIMIPQFGIYGAAWTSVISYNICGICFLFYFRKISKIPINKMIFLQKEDFMALKSLLQRK